MTIQMFVNIQQRPVSFYLVHLYHPGNYGVKIQAPPQGPAYLMEALENEGIEAKYYEYSLNPDINALINDIKQFAPSLIGFSFFSHGYQKSYAIINKVAELGIPIICGGAHTQVNGNQLFEDIQTTFLLKGEGEQSLPRLLKNLNQVEKYPQIPGLIYRQDDQIKTNPPQLIEMAKVRFPRLHGFDLDGYQDRAVSVTSSRGCPFGCTFCQHSAKLGTRWRPRTPESIIEELEYWGSRGHTDFQFTDDLLILDLDRIREICRLIQKSKYRFRLGVGGARVDRTDYDTLKMMRDSGFFHLSFGVESGSDRVLKEIRKGITVAQVHKAVSMAWKLGFELKLYFMVNNRTETYQEVQDSFKLARRYPLSQVRFGNLFPQPGTYDYQWILKHGRLLYDPQEYLEDLRQYELKPLYDGPGMTLEERRQVLQEARLERKNIERPDPYQRGMRALKVNLTLLLNGNHKIVANKFRRKALKLT